MNLTNDIKASLILTIACLSDELNINQYKMYKANNSSIYTISNQDKSIDFTLNFKDSKDLTPMLNSLLNFVNDHTTSMQRSDETILADLCDFLNAHSDIALKFISLGDDSYHSKITNKLSTIKTWLDESNITTDEGKALICTSTLLYNVNRGYYLTPETVAVGLQEELELFNEDVKETLDLWNTNNWLERDDAKITDEQIKEEIKLCTLLTSTEFIPCSFGFSTVINSIGGVKYGPAILDLQSKLEIPTDKQYIFHSKEGLDEDLETLKKDIYSILFTTFGRTTGPIRSIEDADKLDSELSIFSPYYNENAFPVLCDLYREFYPNINPRFQKVLECTILNHASLQNYPIHALPQLNIQDLTYDRLGDITDINYEYINSNNHRKVLNEALKYGLKKFKSLTKINLAAESLQSDETSYDENENTPPLTADALFNYVDHLSQDYEERIKKLKDNKKPHNPEQAPENPNSESSNDDTPTNN